MGLPESRAQGQLVFGVLPNPHPLSRARPHWRLRLQVDEQLSRLDCVKAMTDAVALSTAHRYAEARAVLDAALTTLRASPSIRLGLGSALVRALEADLVQCRLKLASEREATDGGLAFAMQVRRLQ